MDRRAFLEVLATGGVAGSFAIGGRAFAGSGDLGGGEADVLRRVADLQVHRERVIADTARITGDTLPWYPGHAGAMAAVDALSTVPIEDQAHPAMQALMSDLFGTIGAGVLEAHALFEELLAHPEPDGARMAEVVADVKAAFATADVSDDSQRLHKNGLDELGARIGKGGFVGEIKRAHKRIGKLIDLARRIAEDPRETSVLTPADPQFGARVAAGIGRWGAGAGLATQGGGVALTAGRGRFTFLEVLGLIACGIGIFYGTLYFVVSVMCAIACAAPGLLLAALLTGLVVVGCIYGILALNRRRLRRGPPEWGDLPEPTPPATSASTPPPAATGPAAAAAVGTGARVTVSPAVGWTTVPGLTVAPEHRYALLASGGIVFGPEAPRLGPAGDATRDAAAGDLVPNEPIGALVARVGATVLVVGDATLLPTGLSGPLELAVNGPEGPRDGATGGFTVKVEQLK